MGQTVIDMSLIRMHFARRCISDRSLSVLDYSFFKENDSKKSQWNPSYRYNAGEKDEESKKEILTTISPSAER